MAIVAVHEEDPYRDARNTIKAEREFTRTFDVEVNNTDDPPEIIQGWVGPPALPVLGSSYPGDEFAIAVGIAIDRPHPLMWRVTYTYSSTPPVNPNQNVNTPWERPPVWSGSFRVEKKPAQMDRSETPKPYTNSANVPLSNPVPELGETVVMLTAEVIRRQVDYPLATLLAWNDKVNSGAWLGFPQYTVKVQCPEFHEHYERGVACWKIKWAFEANINTPWIPTKYIDQGQLELDPDDATKHRRISDRYGAPVTQDVLLDGAGHRLDANIAVPYEREFQDYYTADFNTLW